MIHQSLTFIIVPYPPKFIKHFYCLYIFVSSNLNLCVHMHTYMHFRYECVYVSCFIKVFSLHILLSILIAHNYMDILLKYSHWKLEFGECSVSRWNIITPNYSICCLIFILGFLVDFIILLAIDSFSINPFLLIFSHSELITIRRLIFSVQTKNGMFLCSKRRS